LRARDVAHELGSHVLGRDVDGREDRRLTHG
jgi:hypothetical protein